LPRTRNLPLSMFEYKTPLPETEAAFLFVRSSSKVRRASRAHAVLAIGVARCDRQHRSGGKVPRQDGDARPGFDGGLRPQKAIE
ncbi:hypothetical protein, partial [Bradyrhizobium sp. S3.9.2]|uniref:hypothetical protein n=1 Tax=unclassified Bradyrhizobium TaxID=2631580 RepID=UPI00339A86DD